MTTKTYPYEPGRFLETEQDIAEFLDAILETGDPATIVDGIGIAARARGLPSIRAFLGKASIEPSTGTATPSSPRS